MILKYNHYGTEVFVRNDLKGKHREHCLCYICGSLDTNNPDNNCPIANILFAISKGFALVFPVYECPNFIQKELDK